MPRSTQQPPAPSCSGMTAAELAEIQRLVEDLDGMLNRLRLGAIREQLDGWAPPFTAVIPADPGVRACQNDFVVPVTRRQEFAQGIDQVVDFFYREALGAPAERAAGGRVKSLFGGIKVRFT